MTAGASGFIGQVIGRGQERQSVRVRVPATSANLGPGFDCAGLALGLYDEVEVRRTARGLTVEVSGEGAADVPLDERHLVVRALYAAMQQLGHEPAGLHLRCVNRIPHGRGLGSSAAAIVAGVLAAGALHGGMDDSDVLALAAEIEGHPDNVAPCVAGSFTLAWLDGGRARAVRLSPVSQLRAVAFVPDVTSSTEQARRLLPAQVPHVDAVENAARAALLVEALTRSPELLFTATEDRLHQPYRAPAMPATAELVARLRAAGIAAIVSGSGPTVLSLGTSEEPAPDPGPGWRTLPLPIDRDGATVSA